MTTTDAADGQALSRRAYLAALSAVLAAGVALVLCVPFFAASPDGFLDQFQFHLDRPVQVESTPANHVGEHEPPSAS